MSATTGAPAPPGPAAVRRKPVDSRAAWSLGDRIGLAIAWGLGLLFCAICAAIILFFLVQGLRYLSPSLIFTNPSISSATETETGGFFDPMIGTFLVALIAIAIAAPVGIWIAVWLSEYARPSWLARIAESTVEMLAGAPTIVLALFGILLFQAPALGFLSETVHGAVFGRSFFGAGAMLSLVALPLVVSTVREGLQSIPNHVREASYAVGKTKIATTRRVLLPAVRPSVITGTMLGVGRVIGDTAIIVVLLGDTQTLQGVGSVPLLGILRGTGSTLTSYIFDNAPTGELNQPGKAYAAAFVLIVIVLGLNLFVDILGRRARELRWS